MMQSEFEQRLGHSIPPIEWPVITRIYAHHPEIQDVGGKDQIAKLYSTYGFSRLASLMLADANAAAAKRGDPPVHREIEEWFGTSTVADDGRILETRPKTIGQVYAYLRTQLGDLIDEYFSICTDSTPATGNTDPWPLDSRWIAVYPVTGNSEGHYVHVDSIAPDGTRRLLYLAKTFRGMAHAWRIAQRLGELLDV